MELFPCRPPPAGWRGAADPAPPPWAGVGGRFKSSVEGSAPIALAALALAALVQAPIVQAPIVQAPIALAALNPARISNTNAVAMRAFLTETRRSRPWPPTTASPATVHSASVAATPTLHGEW
ncbi:MAG: hypothetical protein QOF20_2023 [Acidimicrobiaceae bacterium]|nr:hypothetical protein [Acidimicrobiaceae bacterium]MDQ1420185.1 hypothetical protein [Acidimicrobiaceae bacterium]